MGSLKRIRRRKMMAQGGRCYYCGLQMWDDAAETASFQRNNHTKRTPRALRCTAEHLHARSDGGRDTDENIVAACWYCNNQRHRRKCPHSPEEHRVYVQKRMAAGRWLLAQVSSVGLTAILSRPS
ncbi:restriction endonuclease [Paracoccus sp. DK608]|uniref:Restriction endonuclease n=3 Tax=Paracoccaceae TaxID=31989 RepID=A0A6L6J5W4_9RHOB|nr:restriction endonuclease [Paracoccus shanxieyensis]MTH89865.1 restriction endonuclease [Paracoccus shanxieyensis]